ncbi:NAD(P)H-dependent glycerol-3-phosphate dehydrogenase [Jannaschia sp. KMU-145]|uniref:NAD(P)H-dependent glycerol-3-phosphate dehydrogenase n=1 Tax=Jannaschia halovivens TaxID=3388667 RepID=UPI00396B1FF3
MSAPIGIVGAGAFGTALAVALARADTPVRLWGRDRAILSEAVRTRCLPRLPGVTLPPPVLPTADPADLTACDTILMAVPMQTLGAVLADLPIEPAHLVAACKGVDLATGRGATAILRDMRPDAVPAILSGPSFAADIARGLPTALVLGCADDAVGATLQTRLATPVLRVYRSTDTIGVELGGALKNVVAIPCGAAIGAGLGDSARAALMTRGMAEMMRLAAAMGARTETLMGLSGLGDLALTCASPQSRNFALGHAIGAGSARPDATTEGAATARAALDLAARHDIDLPVTRATAGLVAGDLTVENAMHALLSRDLRSE